MVYSALFGGGTNIGLGPVFEALALDPAGDVYFTGFTQTQSLPVVKPIQRTLNGPQNAFVGELDPTGGKFKFLTYYGGSGYDGAYGIGLDAAGNVYFSGIAGSQDFPVQNAYQSTNPASACFLGIQSSFVTELTPSGTSVVYSTYFGGTTGCEATFSKMAVGSDGKAYITGWTNSTDLPLTADAFQATPNPNMSTTAFLTVFQSGGQSLFYSTYLGGSGSNVGDQVTLSPDGSSAFVSGEYFSDATESDFPVTPGAYNIPHDGNPANNQFGTKISATFLAKFCLTCGPSFENCLGRRRYGDVQPKSSKALHEIVLEVFLIGLLQVVSTEIAVGVAGLQHGVCDDQHGVSDGHHCSFDTSSRCQAPELG